VKVWVDADACPVPIRNIIVRAVHRLSVATVFVANKQILLPESPHLSAVQVSRGPDIADAYIETRAEAGDLVVTQDIPLAAQLVPRGVTVISPRGFLFTEDNINESLATRDLMQSLRDAGTVTGGPRPFDDKLKREFARHFDSALHKLHNKPNKDST
jgi:uncharacterized protein YaiI (UPF0178 family)